jgi:hypothetical protein
MVDRSSRFETSPGLIAALHERGGSTPEGRAGSAADTVIGLATVARLLAIDLAAAMGGTEAAALERLHAGVEQLQHPIGGVA